ncbi:hypothetical protein PAEPH01_0673 [Pancytospora epiphaga]|nr:hypothetical protein PAEPH01_0673 [Pancytospora epiphaga]
MPTDLKLVCFYFSILFILSYSLRLLRLFIAFPLPVLPNWFNTLFLIATYACILYSRPLVLHSLFSNQNALCIGLFLTFPPHILLFPFYVLSLFHAHAYVLSKKRTWADKQIFKFCLMTKQQVPYLVQLAHYSEIVALVLAIPYSIIGLCSKKTLIAYGVVVRQQYIYNPIMNGIIKSLFIRFDEFMHRLPDGCLKIYKKAKYMLLRETSIQNKIKKNQ